MEKKYQDSGYGYREVAVLISTGFGAGWTTWGMPEEALFDPILIDFVENNETNSDAFDEYLEKEYPGKYSGGADGLYVCWVPEGKEFRIEEYDGAENLVLKADGYWTIA
jgi:hypothetical protein